MAVLEENSTKYYIITLVLILYIIAFSKEKKEKILTILPFILLQILILGYLIKEGRIPDRVITPLQYCYIVTNLYIVMKEEKIKENLVNILKHNKIMIIIITLVIFTISLNIKIDERTSTSLKIGNSMEKYFKENSNNFYIYDNNFLTEFELFNGMKVNNYINMSGWTAYSPIYMERLKSLDVESLKDLLLRDNVYLILDKSLNINDYKNIILNAKIEKIESVERFNIYKFTK